MSSFRQQLADAKAAHLAASALEDSARAAIAEIFAGWDEGRYTSASVRLRLEDVVRQAYRSAAAVANQLALAQGGIPNWTPKQVKNTDYLKALLADVRRNLREYRKAKDKVKARRKAIMNMQHSAGVAAQRGYTDSVISSYAELENIGFEMEKMWCANFVNNVPCPVCQKLHGTRIGLHEEFPIPTLSATKVYVNLQGPPRHPRCRCYLVILIYSLDNANEELDVDEPGAEGPTEMSSEDVRKLPKKFFDSIVSTLDNIWKAFRRKKK